MNYNFTDRVRKILAVAREEAIRLQHEHIRAEHLFLALLREGDGTAVSVLTKLSVDLEEIKGRVEEASEKGEAVIALGDLPYTAQTKQMLEYAADEARNLGHSYVGTEHLLLGFLRSEEGIGQQVLNSVALELEATRAEVLKVLGSEEAPSESERGPLDTTEHRALAGGDMRLLYRVLREEAGERSAVKESIKDLKARIDALEERLARLEEGGGPP